MKFEQFEAAMISPLEGRDLSDLELFVASLLLRSTSAQPVPLARVRRLAQDSLDRKISERTVKGTIRTLRRDHKFPILARRSKPFGYWWCSSTDEMEEFVKSFKSQALDELKTISEIVKHNHPQLAGQLSLTE